MNTDPRLLPMMALVFVLALEGCQSYSTPYRDEEGSLNDKYRRGEISKDDYERELSLQRQTLSGTTGEDQAPPPSGWGR